jgi:hypothetical protein
MSLLNYLCSARTAVSAHFHSFWHEQGLRLAGCGCIGKKTVFAADERKSQKRAISFLKLEVRESYFRSSGTICLPAPLSFITRHHRVHSFYSHVILHTIDLVLIDPQSVGKRSLDLMDTVNAKKRWTTIY